MVNLRNQLNIVQHGGRAGSYTINHSECYKCKGHHAPPSSELAQCSRSIPEAVLMMSHQSTSPMHYSTKCKCLYIYNSMNSGCMNATSDTYCLHLICTLCSTCTGKKCSVVLHNQMRFEEFLMFPVHILSIGAVYIRRYISHVQKPISLESFTKTYLVCCVLAAKYIDDTRIFNDFIVEKWRFAIKDINHIEISVLKLFRFNLDVDLNASYLHE
ncbi:hypothetical protein HK407_12g17060 [Ordospora pajunii]|uniref:uncharacterized protein n=1 Tax=Ordospora pajunii TaxID=3039483 RepID=UPI0029526F9B|nr:uncharacterized protein HK407_12g17060 [Ordospora pajunii]KAH9410575.1 hypothetical protein HK407_12g17060 [Ordospora pajunii]